MRIIRARARVRSARFASALVTALCLVPSPAHPSIRIWFSWNRSPQATAFVGTALSDSLPVGWGLSDYLLYPLRTLLACDRTPHGQVVRVQELSRTAPTALAVAIARGGGTVVLAPRGVLGMRCRRGPFPVHEGGLRPGTHGLFIVRLPNATERRSGKPVLNVLRGVTAPYPHIGGLIDPYSGFIPAVSHDSILTAREMLALHDVLPTTADRAKPADVRYAAVWRWAAANPELATRWPARGFLRHTRIAARTEPEERRIRALESPVAGTYRFVFTLGSGDSLAVYARSERRPASVLWSEKPPPPGDPPPDSIPARAAGYSLSIEAARSESALSRWRWFRFGASRQGYLSVIERPEVATNDSTVWRVGLDLSRVAGEIAENARASAELQGVERVKYELLAKRELTFAPGRLVRYADGRLRLTEAIHRGGKLLVVIRGERISDQTFPGPPTR